MAEPRRAQRRWNERLYLVRDPLGNPREVPGASSVAKVLGSPGLTRYLVRRGVYAAIQSGVDPEDAIKQAFTPGEEAELGTAVHEACEQYDLGQTYDNLYSNYVDRWAHLLDEHNLAVEMVEHTVAHSAIGYAGTLDRLTVRNGGRRQILDIKTGKGVWPDVAIQLALLANSEGLLEADGSVTPWAEPIDTQTALIAHIDKTGKHDLIPINIGDAWKVAQHCVDIWHWQRTNKLAVGDPIPGPITEAVNDLARRARRLQRADADAFTQLVAEVRGITPRKLGTPAGWTGGELALVTAVFDKIAPLPPEVTKDDIDELEARYNALHPNTRSAIKRRLDKHGVGGDARSWNYDAAWRDRALAEIEAAEKRLAKDDAAVTKAARILKAVPVSEQVHANETRLVDASE